jgi:hypothetical protein
MKLNFSPTVISRHDLEICSSLSDLISISHCPAFPEHYLPPSPHSRRYGKPYCRETQPSGPAYEGPGGQDHAQRALVQPHVLREIESASTREVIAVRACTKNWRRASGVSQDRNAVLEAGLQREEVFDATARLGRMGFFWTRRWRHCSLARVHKVKWLVKTVVQSHFRVTAESC